MSFVWRFYRYPVFTQHTCNLCLSFFRPDILHEIAAHLSLLPSLPSDQSTTYSKQFLLELLVAHHERRPSQLETINNTPLYPTEDILWDESIVPYEYFDGEGMYTHWYSYEHNTDVVTITLDMACYAVIIPSPNYSSYSFSFIG